MLRDKAQHTNKFRVGQLPGAIFVEQTHDGINLVARKKQSDGLQPASKFSFT